MLSQFTTPSASFCPAGYVLTSLASSNVIPSSPTAAQLAAEQGAMCQNPAGQLLEDVQGQPLGIALMIGAAAALVLLPGFFKIAAAPLAFFGYCQINQQACIVSL
jgi:hypothetical protein